MEQDIRWEQRFANFEKALSGTEVSFDSALSGRAVNFD